MCSIVVNIQQDEQLYNQLQSGGSPAAFSALYDRYASGLFRFVVRFTQNDQAAEDILQDIFTQLILGKFRKGDNAEDGVHLKSWLFTLAKNHSLNYLRQRKQEDSSPETIDSLQDATSLEENTLQKNLLRLLSTIETKLPSELKDTWALRKSGLNYDQIASKLGIPVGTVKSRFHRLVDFLRKELSP